ncbi:MAG: HPr family phosphocarrier protein [Lachnospiraceae bacterium]|nr:HPr family phosphocarrier protein [Lachnospiraceae bacterium]MBP3610128.1 HPr family phosphocarrier protein [Lachnospiraceae bacterium]
MVTKELVMKDFARLDASPAAMLVQLASKFDSSVYVDQAEKRTNAKSIMGVMILNFAAGTKATVTVEGPDESDALAEIEKFLEA